MNDIPNYSWEKINRMVRFIIQKSIIILFITHKNVLIHKDIYFAKCYLPNRNLII